MQILRLAHVVFSPRSGLLGIYPLFIPESSVVYESVKYSLINRVIVYISRLYLWVLVLN